jgi:hypothetical protein
MPPAEVLIGRCRKGWNNVCTNRANFHVFLGNLGKTNITTNAEEMKYVNMDMRRAINPLRSTRKVFLYEVSQLSDKDTDRSITFRQDLQHFLHLKQPISPFIWFKPGQSRSLSIRNETTIAADVRKIDICDVKYEHLREILLHHAIQASHWICKYFLNADGVIVSSQKHFESTLLKTWEVDPCVERRNRTKREN